MCAHKSAQRFIAYEYSSTVIKKDTTQIGILVPIVPERRNNGTSETGSSIKHLKAVPSKTKKAPKRGNCHSPLKTYSRLLHKNVCRLFIKGKNVFEALEVSHSMPNLIPLCVEQNAIYRYTTNSEEYGITDLWARLMAYVKFSQ